LVDGVGQLNIVKVELCYNVVYLIVGFTKFCWS